MEHKIDRKGASHLVWILHDKVFAVVKVHADINDTTQDAPSVIHAQIDLVGKLVWSELLCAEDNVLARVAHIVARHVPTQ